jgi:hypothetical protein
MPRCHAFSPHNHNVAPFPWAMWSEAAPFATSIEDSRGSHMVKSVFLERTYLCIHINMEGSQGQKFLKRWDFSFSSQMNLSKWNNYYWRMIVQSTFYLFVNLCWRHDVSFLLMLMCVGKSHNCFLLHRYEGNMRKQSGEKVKENQVYEPLTLKSPHYASCTIIHGHAIHRPGFIYRMTIIIMQPQDKAQKRPECYPYRWQNNEASYL